MTRTVLLAGTALLLAAPPSPAQPAARPAPADVKAVVAKAYDFLKAKQGADGAVAPRLGGPGITALVVAGLIRHGYAPDDPVVAKGLKYLESQVQPDGGVYNRRLANYTTCLAVLAFAEANKDGRYKGVIDNAAKFLRSLQKADEVSESDPKYGGTGYDGSSRPDLSNTQFFVEALAAAGAKGDDAALKKAMAFVGRCQNLPGESNRLEYATKADDDAKGGFVYNPGDAADAKNPKRTPEGGLRSEGGMTYAGLKSFLYAGVGKDDPRVQAAVKWLRRHYSVESNPGMGTAGLFYYYQTFAKAMAALGEDEFADEKGQKHPWRAELFAALKGKQKPDGSWANSNPAFLENSPELATAFAVLALSY